MEEMNDAAFCILEHDVAVIDAIRKTNCEQERMRTCKS